MSISVKLAIVVFVAGLGVSAFAQKVKVGFDASVDFAKYKSYSVAEPSVPPARPLLYLSILGSIERELKVKGVVKQEQDGDLILVPAGGVDVGMNVAAGTPYVAILGGPLPVVNSTMWTGTAFMPNAANPYVPEGSLILTFLDRRSNQVVWLGTVTGKFDVEKRSKIPQEVDKAIVKLLQQFPPQKKKT